MYDANFFVPLREMLQQAPSEQLDPAVFPMIKNWQDIPTPESVLEVLDHCVFGALASGFTMSVIETIFDAALQAAGKTEAEVMKTADETWRKEF